MSTTKQPTLTRPQRRQLTDYEFKWCRTFGHDWEEWYTTRIPEFGYYEPSYCPRCTTERLFQVNMMGEVLNRRYVYPEGYKLAFKLTRADLRKALRAEGWFRAKEAQSVQRQERTFAKKHLAVVR